MPNIVANPDRKHGEVPQASERYTYVINEIRASRINENINKKIRPRPKVAANSAAKT
jgi:hypothetical protein